MILAMLLPSMSCIVAFTYSITIVRSSDVTIDTKSVIRTSKDSLVYWLSIKGQQDESLILSPQHMIGKGRMSQSQNMSLHF